MRILIIILIIVLIVIAIVIYKKSGALSFSQFANASGKMNKKRTPLSTDKKLSILQSFLLIFGVFFFSMCFFTPKETICFSKNQVIAKRSYSQGVNVGTENNPNYERQDFYDIIVDVNSRKLDLTYEKSRYDYNIGQLCVERVTDTLKIYIIMTIMCVVLIIIFAFFR